MSMVTPKEVSYWTASMVAAALPKGIEYHMPEEKKDSTLRFLSGAFYLLGGNPRYFCGNRRCTCLAFVFGLLLAIGWIGAVMIGCYLLIVWCELRKSDMPFGNY